MAFMQHYMQMAAGQMEPAAMHMAQYQMAAAQGLNFPGFPGFPPPGIAEQVMAAYAAQAAAAFPPNCFSPYPPTEQQDPVAVAQQQAAAAALASVYCAQQAQPQAQHQSAAHVSSVTPEVSEQAAAAAAFALAQAAAFQGAAPAFPFVTDHACQRAEQDQDFSGGEGHQQAMPQSGNFAQQQAAMPAESTFREKKHGTPLLSTRLLVKDDPAFGNGRLYRPQASHAKASVAPPSTKFGGAMHDNLHCVSTLSRNSSSDSILPPASCCFEAAGSQVNTLKHNNDVSAAGGRLP